MGTRKGAKVPVSLRAVVQRINRRLREKGQTLRKIRGMEAVYRAQRGLGQWYVADVNRNRIVREYADVEELARQLDVLDPWEALSEEEER